jgi:RNA-directed DNA polymerase
MTDIIKTQQGLARKAQFDQVHQFSDLYFLLCKKEWIGEALQHVLSNDGATTAGIDGMSWRHFNDVNKSDFENGRFREQFIHNLQAELKSHTFKPMPVRRVEIPKPGTDKKRPLGIMTIKDRVVQTLLKMVLEPIWESDFLYFSNGFRPTRCTMDCIAPLYTLFNAQQRYRWVIEGDLKACFDTIPQTKLLAEVTRRIGDNHIVKLIAAFLKSGVMLNKQLLPSESGVSQGGPLSPLLANLYLHKLDKWYATKHGMPEYQSIAYQHWLKERKRGQAKAATQMFRYADDWIVLVRGTQAQAHALKAEIKQFLAEEEEMGLSLNEEKTKITHVQDGFDFLGYHIFRGDQAKDRRKVGVFVQPAKKNLKRVCLKIKQMTNSKTLKDDYLNKLKALNAVVRGWANYYRAVNPFSTFEKLDQYVWRRLTKWLIKKYRLSSKQVWHKFKHKRKGVKGDIHEFAALDENNHWVWRLRATQIKIRRYWPSFKRNWPNPYLEKVSKPHFELPTLPKMWNGTTQAPEYDANRREVLRRAGGQCERCGQKLPLTVHHQHRVKRGKRKLREADHRPEMMEALCRKCQGQEHRAETIYYRKLQEKEKLEQTGQG